jgi:hypothetical protein
MYVNGVDGDDIDDDDDDDEDTHLFGVFFFFTNPIFCFVRMGFE